MLELQLARAHSRGEGGVSARALGSHRGCCFAQQGSAQARSACVVLKQSGGVAEYGQRKKAMVRSEICLVLRSPHMSPFASAATPRI